jgi:hypothetical protein
MSAEFVSLIESLAPCFPQPHEYTFGGDIDRIVGILADNQAALANLDAIDVTHYLEEEFAALISSDDLTPLLSTLKAHMVVIEFLLRNGDLSPLTDVDQIFSIADTVSRSEEQDTHDLAEICAVMYTLAESYGLNQLSVWRDMLSNFPIFALLYKTGSQLKQQSAHGKDQLID